MQDHHARPRIARQARTAPSSGGDTIRAPADSSRLRAGRPDRPKPDSPDRTSPGRRRSQMCDSTNRFDRRKRVATSFGVRNSGPVVGSVVREIELVSFFIKFLSLLHKMPCNGHATYAVTPGRRHNLDGIFRPTAESNPATNAIANSKPPLG